MPDPGVDDSGRDRDNYAYLLFTNLLTYKLVFHQPDRRIHFKNRASKPDPGGG